MQVEYVDYLPAEFRISAAHLYMNALRDKFLPVLGKLDKAQPIFENNLTLDHCLSAFCNQKLVGILGIQTGEGGFWNPTMKSLMDGYGLMGGLYRFSGLSLLHHKTEITEWHIDGVAVVDEMRGAGIGSGLLNLLESIAKKSNIRKISLDVVDTNPRAKTLYEHLGFIETKRQNFWPLNLIFKFPFQSSIQMVKSISGADKIAAHHQNKCI